MTETTCEILQTTLRSYLTFVHGNYVSLVSHESLSFSLQYYAFSSTTVSSRSIPLREMSIKLKTNITQFVIAFYSSRIQFLGDILIL